MLFVGLTVAAPTATEAEHLTACLGSPKVSRVTGAGKVKSIHQRQIAMSHLIGGEILLFS